MVDIARVAIHRLFSIGQFTHSYSGSAMNLYVVFFGLLITVIPVMGGMLSLSDQYNRAQQGAVLSAESSGKSYTLTLLNNEMLAFTGDINFGATRDFVSILAAHPNIQTVLLESDGGVIVEARGMANTILDNGLNTRVESDCYSACTLVFISGRVRSLGDKAALGFHQYLLETPYYYCLLYTSPSPRDGLLSRMPSSA